MKRTGMLTGKRILLGVSGGIAAYKAVEVLRLLTGQDAEVRVVMTRNATRFVAPLTFAALSGHPVLTDEFSDAAWGPLGHIAVTEGLDLALIVPATANSIGKAAAGIADDALSTALLAAECPLVMAPAMNDRMYRNAVVQRNIAVLRTAGVRFIEPEDGTLACGSSGQGRLAPAERIMQTVAAVLGPLDLQGTRVLVTAGPTREPLDAVRFISNPSTGRMGYAIAAAARDRGATVVLVSGPTEIQPPRDVEFVPVHTAAEMQQAVLNRAGSCQVIIMAAAVSDFRPKNAAQRKIKKKDASLTIDLERTADILQGLGASKETKILVGFAAETDDVIGSAKDKMTRKNLDLIVANEVAVPGAGFASETNKAVLIDRSGKMTDLPLMPKTELASRIIDAIVELKRNQGL